MAKKKLEKSMSQNGSFDVRQTRYFSEDARRQIVKEIEDGVYSKSEAAHLVLFLYAKPGTGEALRILQLY
ncbi:MAG: hypothetical protein ACOYOA_14890 [Saprospiraceae bacterium]